MPKKKDDSLKLEDRIMAITGSINFKDYSSCDCEILKERMFNCVESWKAIKEYYFIFHDETDIYHLHYVIVFDKQQYVSTCLNRFCDFLNVEPVAVNYKRLLYRNAMLRYIIHQTEESKEDGKKQYDVFDINSNVHYGLIRCFVDSKDNNKRIDMLTLEGVCVSCGGSELKIAEFLDELYDKNYRRIQLILSNYSIVRDKFEELPF